MKLYNVAVLIRGSVCDFPHPIYREGENISATSGDTMSVHNTTMCSKNTQNTP